ncbi:hypothetical protein LX36DRAFT_70622 [Colletotrichum falcatum]|nr:hypothetical protein LX36DRAFT_70622 [Colletotrichum falcatum]
MEGFACASPTATSSRFFVSSLHGGASEPSDTARGVWQMPGQSMSEDGKPRHLTIIRDTSSDNSRGKRARLPNKPAAKLRIGTGAAVGSPQANIPTPPTLSWKQTPRPRPASTHTLSYTPSRSAGLHSPVIHSSSSIHRSSAIHCRARSSE